MSAIGGAVAGALIAAERRRKLNEAMDNVFGPDLYKDANRILVLLEKTNPFFIQFMWVIMGCSSLGMFAVLAADVYGGFLYDTLRHAGLLVNRNATIFLSGLAGFVLSVWITIKAGKFHSNWKNRKHEKALRDLIASDPKHWEPIVVYVKLLLDIVG